jgi:pyrroline-5-carboxylate reductase
MGVNENRMPSCQYGSMSEELLSPGRTLGVIGAGVMGTALLKGMLDHGLLTTAQAWGATKTEASCEEVTQRLGIETVRDYAARVDQAEILILAVKPGQVAKVADKLNASGLRGDTLVITVLAGVSTERLEALLGSENPVLRAMPNTPSLVGHGVTVYCGGRWAAERHLELARKIFSSVGKALEVEEHYFNAITALSGSGPAYMYLVMEALADAGVRVGLPRDLAMELVAQTMLGSARMVQETGRHPAALRDDVTTPAGCTIGGLLMLEDGKIRSVLARAVEEATRIVEQLGKGKT